MDSPGARSVLWMVLAAVIGIALLVVVGGVVMSVAMTGHVCCGSRESSVDQTPFVTSATEITVHIRDFAFSPNDLTIDEGTTVTWVNHDTAPHDATENNGAWRTELLQKNDSGGITFDEPGEFPYHCSVHPYMKSAVTVLAR